MEQVAAIKQFYCVLIGLVLINTISGQENYDLEDAYLTTPQLLEKYGYPTETHNVVTADGYILEIYRVPSSSSKKPIIVQHGLLGSSDDFIIQGPGKALVYALADEGYDVWLPNSRGNRYSRNHTTLNPNKPTDKYWDFSWHEMGVYDNPAVIDYVLEKTGQEKLFHIAHAQGATAFYVLTSEKPEYNDKVIAHFTYAPLAYGANNDNSLISLFVTFVQPLTELTGYREAIFGDKYIRKLAPLACSNDIINDIVCKNIYFLAFGFNSKELNLKLVRIIAGHVPTDASINQILHYGQLIKSKKFAQFDHGSKKNLEIYGTATPPDYDLSKITVPLYFFYSLGDKFSNYRDVQLLKDQVPNVVELIQMDDPDWSNTDYVFGKSAKEKVYEPTIAFLNSIN